MTFSVAALLFCVDKKSHEVFLVSYKSHAEEETKGLDIKEMKSILEEKFGYAVYNCDVLGGKSTPVSKNRIEITESIT